MPRAGDEAYVEYVNGRMLQLRRTAYLLCGDWSRGDDLVQRTLTDVYRSWAKACRADNLDAYVRTIMVHRFIDERRRGWSRVTLVESVPETIHPGSAEAADVRIDVRSALAQLPPQQRAVLVLRFLCDLSVEDTAAALDCATGTVKSRTSAGLVAMRRLLAPNQVKEQR